MLILIQSKDCFVWQATTSKVVPIIGKDIELTNPDVQERSQVLIESGISEY